MVTIKQIAEIAGVHRSTVDKVLHDRPGVSPKVRARVQKIIDELDYHPNPLGQALKKKQNTFTLAAILRKVDAAEPIQQGIQRARMDYAGYDLNVRYEILPCSDAARQANTIDRFVADGVDGILLMPSDSSEVRAAISRAWQANIPVITVNTDVPNSPRSCFVGQNGYEAGRTAGCLMGEFLGGHGKVILITDQLKPESRDSVNYLRDEGFRAVIQDDYPDICIAANIESREDPFLIFSQMMQCLENGQHIDGIYITCGGVSEVGRALRMAQTQKSMKIICFERYSDIIDMLQKRMITCTLDSELDLQGYQSIHLLMDQLLYGKKPETSYQYTKTRILVRENISL